MATIGQLDIKWFGNAVMQQYTAQTKVNMTKAALLLEGDIKKSFGTGAKQSNVKIRRSGRGKNRKFHNPSKPGEVPAIDTGVLRASINHEVFEDASGVVGFVGVESAVKYGLWLELGTRRMKARPFLRPALIRTRAAIKKIFT